MDSARAYPQAERHRVFNCVPPRSASTGITGGGTGAAVICHSRGEVIKRRRLPRNWSLKRQSFPTDTRDVGRRGPADQQPYNRGLFFGIGSIVPNANALGNCGSPGDRGASYAEPDATPALLSACFPPMPLR
jgi:hypothetical protein